VLAFTVAGEALHSLMSFALVVLYLIAWYVRVDEQFPSLVQYPIMFWLGVGGAVTSLLNVLSGKHPTLRAPQLYLMAGLTAMISLSIAFTGWLGGAVYAFEDFSRTTIVFFLIVLNVNSMRRLRIVGATLVLLTIFVAGQGVAAYHWGFQEEKFILFPRGTTLEAGEPGPVQELPSEDSEVTVPRIRGLGFLNDPNDLAQAILFGMPFLFLAWRRGRWLLSLVLIVPPFLFLVYSIYLTHSRGAIVGLCVLVLLALRWRIGQTASLALTSLLALALIGLNFSGNRGFVDESAEARVDAWSEGLQMLKDNPVWGVGYEEFTEYNRKTAHNSFVLCFAELGLAGYFFWLGLLVITLFELHSLGKLTNEEPIDEDLRRWGRAIFLALCAFLAAGMFLSRTYTMTLYIIVALGTALADIARNSERPVFELSPMRWVTRVGALELASILMVYLFIRLAPV